VRFVASRPAGVYDHQNESQFRADVERTLQTLVQSAPATEPAILELEQVDADGAVQLDFRTTDYCRVKLGGSGVITFEFPLGVAVRRSYVVEIERVGVGPIELVFDSGFRWPGGLSPELAEAHGAVDVITLIAPSKTMLFGVAQSDFLAVPRP
jgi:hypothetical protein